MRHRSWWTAVLALGVVAACGEHSTPTTPLFLDPAQTVTSTSSLDASVTALIKDLYPTGLETAGGTRWETVKNKYAAGLTDPAQMSVARKLVFELARWAKSKSASVTPPPGETTDAVISRLVTYMALYVYNGPATPLPTYNTGADAIVGFASPTEESTITTPALRAGINIDPGSVSENTIVTITQNPQSYPTTCNGPLTTRRCQYPLFYDIHVYPHVKFLKPAHVAVCHVTPGSNRRPLDAPGSETVHDRLRLAHPLPASASDYTEGATQHSGNGENIEILPLSLQQGSSGVDCDAFPVTASGPVDRILGRFASTLGSMLSPAPLYAVDQGPEHYAEFTSPFNSVDPAGRPDVAAKDVGVQGSVSPTSNETYQGETVTLDYAISNTSPVYGGAATATALATAAGVYLSTDGIVDASDEPLLALPQVPSLPPDAVGPSGTVPVTIPLTTAPGPYHLGIHVTPPGSGLGEVTTANNGAGVPLVVRSPVVSTVTIESSTAPLDQGQTRDLSATSTGRGNFQPDVVYTWSSSNPAVASVSGSQLTGVGGGTTNVTVVATVGASSTSATTPITVVASTGSISGTVIDAFTGAGLSGATVTTGTASTTTSSGGAFTLAGIPAGTVDLSISAPNYLSGSRNGVAVAAGTTVSLNAIGLNPVSAPADIRIVLEWGACQVNSPSGNAPCDLDSHLTGPTSSASRFHVYYASRIFSDPASAANLDLDDTNGLGPETITITRQAGSGVYRYYVHDWTNRANSASTALANSGATVRVFRGATLLATYSPPAGGVGTAWKVFELDGTTLTELGQIIFDGTAPVLNAIASDQPGVAAYRDSGSMFRDLPPKPTGTDGR